MRLKKRKKITERIHKQKHFMVVEALFCSFARVFAKLPRPGDSELIFAVFESSCHLILTV